MARTKPACLHVVLLLAGRNSLSIGAATAMQIILLCRKHFMAGFLSALLVLASSPMIWAGLRQQPQQIFIRDGVHLDACLHTAAYMALPHTGCLGFMMMRHVMCSAIM